MLRNMATSLFLHGRIITTPAKAKEARPFAERLITIAKRGAGSLAARRRAIQLLHDPKVVASLFTELAPRYKERAGGYTRILHLENRRVGDGSPLALFELVEAELPRRGKKGAVAAVAKDEPKAEVDAGAESDAKAETSEEAKSEQPESEKEKPAE